MEHRLDWTDTGFVSPRAARADFLWPTIPPATDAAFFALLFQLERTQWWSPERLRAYQLLQLSTLLAHAAARAPGQRQRLRGLADLPAGALDAETFAQIPVMTRDQALAAGHSLHSTAPPSEHGQPRAMVTSGSSGTPFRFFRTQWDGLVSAALVQRGHLWYERDLMASNCQVGRSDAHGEGPRTSWSQFFPTGPSHLIDVRHPADQVLERILQLDPQVLNIWPSLLAEVLRIASRRGARPTQLGEVLTYGERVPPGLATRCREVWGARLIDNYSCEEIGGLAHQCPVGDGYHVHAEHVLLEVLDERDRPCAPGETGRVVVSNLHNFATPTIRLELGDLATVGEPCSCGRGLPVLRGIAGRVRDLLTLPDGRRVMPSFDEVALLAALPTLRQFQLVPQVEPGEVEVLLVLDGALAGEASRMEHAGLSDTQRQGLERALGASLGHAFRFSFRRVDAIARGPGGKAEPVLGRGSAARS